MKEIFESQQLLAMTEFDSLQNILKEKDNIKCNPMAADEHVTEVELMIQAVKAWISASCGQMLWKKATPKLIMREAVKNSTTMIDVFPPKSGINNHFSL